MAMRELITHLPDAWPLLGGVLALALPRLVRELRRLIFARTVSRLGQAAIDKQWSDERFKLVIRLIHDVDRNSAPGRLTPNEQPGDSGPSDARRPDEPE